MKCVHCAAETEGTSTPKRQHVALCPDCYTKEYHAPPGPPPHPGDQTVPPDAPGHSPDPG